MDHFAKDGLWSVWLGHSGVRCMELTSQVAPPSLTRETEACPPARIGVDGSMSSATGDPKNAPSREEIMPPAVGLIAHVPVECVESLPPGTPVVVADGRTFATTAAAASTWRVTDQHDHDTRVGELERQLRALQEVVQELQRQNDAASLQTDAEGSTSEESRRAVKHPKWPILRSIDTFDDLPSARSQSYSGAEGRGHAESEGSSRRGEGGGLDISSSLSSGGSVGQGIRGQSGDRTVRGVSFDGEAGEGGSPAIPEAPLRPEPLPPHDERPTKRTGILPADASDAQCAEPPDYSPAASLSTTQQTQSLLQTQALGQTQGLTHSTGVRRRKRSKSYGSAADGDLLALKELSEKLQTDRQQNGQWSGTINREGEKQGVTGGAFFGPDDRTVGNSTAEAGAALNGTRRRATSVASINKLMGYLWMEVFGAQEYYEKEEVTSKADTVIHNFLAVPFKLETCLAFGMVMAFDAFLYTLTFLPLRVLYSAYLALVSCVIPRRRRVFHRNNAYDLMRGIIVVMACMFLRLLQISRVYHYIRGQATIKLYVLTAMFEIFDKLLISFGQDTVDSLYWSAKLNTSKRHVARNFVVSACYVVVHSLLLFTHVVTLFVAVNSADQALLTLLISNNFAEMKSSVFKRFDAKLLFQLTCADMVERFKLLLFLFLITILNIVQHLSGDGGMMEVLRDMVSVTLLIFGGEILADCLKHAFITKFNEIDSSCYDKSMEELAKEVTLYRRERNLMLDHTHIISKKLCLAQLPLAAIVVRFLGIAWAGSKVDISALGFAGLVMLLFVILVAVKIILGLLVIKWAARIVNCSEDVVLSGGVVGKKEGLPSPRSPRTPRSPKRTH